MKILKFRKWSKSQIKSHKFGTRVTFKTSNLKLSASNGLWGLWDLDDLKFTFDIGNLHLVESQEI